MKDRLKVKRPSSSYTRSHGKSIPTVLSHQTDSQISISKRSSSNTKQKSKHQPKLHVAFSGALGILIPNNTVALPKRTLVLPNTKVDLLLLLRKGYKSDVNITHSMCSAVKKHSHHCETSQADTLVKIGEHRFQLGSEQQPLGRASKQTNKQTHANRFLLLVWLLAKAPLAIRTCKCASLCKHSMPGEQCDVSDRPTFRPLRCTCLKARRDTKLHRYTWLNCSPLAKPTFEPLSMILVPYRTDCTKY